MKKNQSELSELNKLLEDEIEKSMVLIRAKKEAFEHLAEALRKSQYNTKKKNKDNKL